MITYKILIGSKDNHENHGEVSVLMIR